MRNLSFNDMVGYYIYLCFLFKLLVSNMNSIHLIENRLDDISVAARCQDHVALVSRRGAFIANCYMPTYQFKNPKHVHFYDIYPQTLFFQMQFVAKLFLPSLFLVY